MTSTKKEKDMKGRTNIQSIIDKLLNLFLVGFTLIFVWFFSQVFFFSSFRIPSNSMEPGLIEGDAVLVWKPILGARLFNVNATLNLEQVTIYRTPGLRQVQRNDVLVFNFPHPNQWDKIEMHILRYYIKRCIGLPGDSLSIHKGEFQVKGVDLLLGNKKSQLQIGATRPEDFAKGVYNSFLFDSSFNWTIQEFGPFYIPKSGDELVMNHTHYLLYRKLIEWEQQGKLTYQDKTVYLNGRPIKSYRFLKNYYFMAGDNGMNSQDSRYWGLLPEEYIVGKAVLIWKSIDPHTETFRWERFLKRIE